MVGSIFMTYRALGAIYIFSFFFKKKPIDEASGQPKWLKVTKTLVKSMIFFGRRVVLQIFENEFCKSVVLPRRNANLVPGPFHFRSKHSVFIIEKQVGQFHEVARMDVSVLERRNARAQRNH